jgi:hypothetical protein
MAGTKNDEGIEFIVQHWDLISEPKKKILQILGITPHKPKQPAEYETNLFYQARYEIT